MRKYRIKIESQKNSPDYYYAEVRNWIFGCWYSIYWKDSRYPDFGVELSDEQSVGYLQEEECVILINVHNRSILDNKIKYRHKTIIP